MAAVGVSRVLYLEGADGDAFLVTRVGAREDDKPGLDEQVAGGRAVAFRRAVAGQRLLHDVPFVLRQDLAAGQKKKGETKGSRVKA